jgi:hypothetical protein
MTGTHLFHGFPSGQYIIRERDVELFPTIFVLDRVRAIREPTGGCVDLKSDLI